MDGYVTIGTELDTKSFDKEIASLEAKLNDIEASLQMASEDKTLFSTSEIREMETESEKLRNRLIDLQKKQLQVGKTDFSQIQKSFNNIGNSVQNVTKKVVRWGLAVFGIRSAYMAVRNAINVISQDDQQLAADIEYMKNALAYTLEPIVRGIVNLMKQLMFYVSYIVKAWTGRDIFANANKSLKGATGNAKALNKELNKTIAGFDEMNTLQDTSSSGGSDAGGGATLPSFDLSGLQGDVPDWLKWIVDNKDLILSVMAGVAAGLLAWKLGLSGLQSLGIGLAVFFIVQLIQDIIKFLNDPTFENFINILRDIAGAVFGVAIAVGAWPVAIAAAVAFVIIEIVKHFDEIMGLFNNLIAWMDKNVLGKLKKMFGPLGNILYAPIKAFVELAKGAFESFYGGIKKIIEGVVKIFKGDFFGGIKQIFGGLLSVMTAPLKGFLSGAWAIVQQVYALFRDLGTRTGDVIGAAFKTAVNGVMGAIETILNSPIRAINGLIGVINKVPGINLGRLSTFNLPRLAKGGIINMPGQGVMVGSAIAGERGQEGVIPLTDSQQMELLGEAIGKYITINANITNTMNGRVISRELQKVQNENDFAFNR